ncbi:hypothetical protein D3C75_821910 [compost metagenome]
MGAADGVEQGMQRALAQGGLQLVLPVGVVVVEHPTHTKGLECGVVALASTGPHAQASLRGQLREVEAHRATGADHQHVAAGTFGHLGQGLPGGQGGAGHGGRGGVAERTGDMHHQAGIQQAVLGKAAVTRQRLVVGNAAAQRHVDACANGDYHTGAIHARDRALLPGRVAPLADFPVHRVEGNGAVGHQHLTGAGLWQGFTQQLQAVEAGVRGPGPGLMIGWHGAGPFETGVGGRLAGIKRGKQVR